jgi:hypothetical protein
MKESAGVGYHGTAEQFFVQISRRDFFKSGSCSPFSDPDAAVWFTQHPEVQAGVGTWR